MNAVVVLPQSTCIHCNSHATRTDETACSVCQEPFIIDGGQSHTVPLIDGGSEYLPRYEVWRYDLSRSRMQRIDRADCLKELQAKHRVPDDRIIYWPICGSPPVSLWKAPQAPKVCLAVQSG